jgi:predicted PurR-regulated permease PerM
VSQPNADVSTTVGTAPRRAALLLAGVSIGIIAIGLSSVAAGLLAAPALAVIYRPLQRRLRNRLSSRLAAVTVVASAWIVLVVPGVWLAAKTLRQLPDAVTGLRRGADALRALPMPLPR